MIRIKLILIAAAILTCWAATSVQAQEIEYVNSTLLGGLPFDIYVDSSFAYVASINSFYIVSLADPDSMTLVGGMALAGLPQKLKKMGNYVYLAYGSYGLQIIDITEPDRCRLAGRFDMAFASAVDVQGDYAYLADGVSGDFYVLDISDPYRPIQTGLYFNAGSSFRDVVVSGQYAYLADTTRVRVINISDPWYPHQEALFATQFRPAALYVQDTLLFVASNLMEDDPYVAYALEIYDISNPRQPVPLGETNPRLGRIRDIAFRDNFVYLSSLRDSTSLEIYDVGNPNYPIYYPGNLVESSTSIFAHDDQLYITLSTGGEGRHDFIRENISNPVMPQLEGEYYSLDNTYAVALKDSTAYAVGDGWLAALDVSNPQLPRIRARITGQQHLRSIAIAGDYIYAAGFNGISIFHDSIDDIEFVMSFSKQYVPVIQVEGNRFYAADRNDGLLIFDITNPSNPDLIGNYPLESVVDIDYQGDYVFMARYWPSEFKIINVSDPATPYLVSSLDIPGDCSSLDVMGNYAFVACDYPDSLFAIDVSYVAEPVIISRLQLPFSPYSPKIRISNNFAFIALGNYSGLAIYDISNPSFPALVSTFDTPGYASEVFVRLPYIYVADVTSLQILRFNPTGIDEAAPMPNEFALLQNYPNPFNATTMISYSLPAGFTGTLAIYDITGRMVRTLDIIPGTSHITWEGTNGVGRSVSSGVYFYAVAGHPETARKMVLLR